MPTATELSVGLGQRRRRGVKKGEFMLTPVKPLSLTEHGRSEELWPGRSRLAPDHWAVGERPEWFRPCDPTDKVTAARHRKTLERTRQRLLGGTAPSKHKPTWRLPSPAPRGRWRLP